MYSYIVDWLCGRWPHLLWILFYYCIIWIYCLVVDEGREGRDSARVAMYRSHLLLYCKFPTSRNLKETLAKFFKNPRIRLFGTIVTLGWVKNSFGLISMRETCSKRLDVVEADISQICPVRKNAQFSPFAAFKPSQNLENHVLDWETFCKSPQLWDSESGSSSYRILNIARRVG